MKLLDDYFRLQKQIYDYFGYVEDWRVIPIDDATYYYWCFTESEFSTGQPDGVRYAVEKESLFDGSGNCYSCEIYRQRFLPKWVYRGKDYTMVCVDTHTDGNKFLQVFDNSKEVKEGDYDEMDKKVTY